LEGLTKEEIRIFEELFKGVSTHLGYKTLKSISKIWISPFVNPSKIFVWEHKVEK